MFKPTEEIDDFKKNRDKDTEIIRRTNRDEIFSKRRNIIIQEEDLKQQQENENHQKTKLLVVDERFRPQIESFLKSQFTVNNFGDLLASINGSNILQQHWGMIGIRKILSVVDSPPIQAVIDAGLVPKMIEYLKQSQYPQLQLQATWALTNVASGTSTQCKSIIDRGGIPLFVQLLKSTNYGILEQAIWAIGNIASDCVAYRDLIIKIGGLQSLVNIVATTPDQTFIKHGCWALSNLCRGNPIPKYDSVKTAIPVLCRAIACQKISDKEIISDCCWAISYHSDSNKSRIQVVVESNIIPTIIKNLQATSMSVLVPSIRILGNISTGTVQHTNQLLNHGILNYLQKLLDHPKKVIRREACWVISNITAGTRIQTQAVLSRQSLLLRIFQMFQTESNDIRRQICYIFSNFSHAGDPAIIFQLYKESHIVRFYANLLAAEDNKTIEVALQCLFIILTLGEKFKHMGGNPLAMDLRNMSALQVLQKLQYHKSDLVYQQVTKILYTFFQTQDTLKV